MRAIMAASNDRPEVQGIESVARNVIGARVMGRTTAPKFRGLRGTRLAVLPAGRQSNDRPEVQGIERSGMSGSSLHPASNDRPEVQGIERG